LTPERDQQIMDIFLAAVELPKDRRTTYLDEACGPDEALRAEVESLVEHHAPDTLISRDGANTPARPNTKSRPLSKIRPTYEHRRVLKKLSRRRFTVASIVLSGCLAVLWYVVHQSISQKLRQNVRSQLQTVLNADVSAVEIWLAKQMQTAESWAKNLRLRVLLAELARISAEQKLTTSELEATEQHTEFLETISPLLAQPESLSSACSPVMATGSPSVRNPSLPTCTGPRVAPPTIPVAFVARQSSCRPSGLGQTW